MKFSVEVRPHSRKSEAVKLADGDLKVFVKSPPAEGKANAEATALLARHFGVPKSSVVILKGARGRKKIVEVNFKF